METALYKEIEARYKEMFGTPSGILGVCGKCSAGFNTYRSECGCGGDIEWYGEDEEDMVDF